MSQHRPWQPTITGTASLRAQLEMMIRALLASQVRNRLALLGFGIFVIIVLTTYGQIRLNRWNQPFYDALARRNLHEFGVQLGVFCVIACVLLVLNVAQRFLAEELKLKLREGLARDLIGEWLKPGRALRLSKEADIGANPDQRMHEDARHLTELSGDLGVGLLQSAILLATFVEVLWAISGHFALTINGHVYQIPGYMVWGAIFYAGAGSLASWLVGRHLVARNAERYQRESGVRFALMQTNEHVAELDASPDAREKAQVRIFATVDNVLQAMWKLVLGVTNLTWVTAGYGWLSLVAPILIAAPAYFGGELTFGGMMMAVGAFNQVQQSLRWFVDNFSTIADWRATLLRVAELRRALLICDGSEGEATGHG